MSGRSLDDPHQDHLRGPGSNHHRCGQCRRAGHNQRTCPDLGRAPTPTPAPSPPQGSRWTPEVIAQLGEVPDTAIAAQLGVCRERVRAVRASLGVARCAPTRWRRVGDADHQTTIRRNQQLRKLEEAYGPDWDRHTNAEIGQILQIGQSTVCQLRKRLERPAPRPPNSASVLLDAFRTGPKTSKEIAEILRAAGLSPVNPACYARRCPGVRQLAYGLYGLEEPGGNPQEEQE